MSTIQDHNQQTDKLNGLRVAASAKIKSLHELLGDRAERFADRRAYTFQGADGDQIITFAELDRRARAVAATLQKSVEPGDRVLLLFNAGLDFISSFFGCLYAGTLAVPTTYPKPRRPMPRLTSIARDCGAVAVLTDSNTLSNIDSNITTSVLPHMKWLAIDQVEISAADHLQVRKINGDTLAFLQYTSGSTSDPKGVMVSHANLLHNLEMIRQGFGLRSAESGGEIQTGVFWLPAYHDMGLIGGILESMYVGGHSVLMSPAAFLQRPIGWLEAMSQHSATISGAPNFAYELTASRSSAEQRRNLDLTNWKVAFCGAEPIRADSLRQFAEAFAVSGFRERAFYPCYGLAEGTLLASGGRGPSELTRLAVDREALGRNRVVVASEDAADDDTQSLVGCGAAMLDQEIAIVDPHTCLPCAPNMVGEIWVQGPSIAAGYWGRKEESEQVFQARIADSHDGPFLRTGDLGFTAEGHLFVTGRVKDMMIIRGRNHYPQDIEKTASDAHPALRQDSGAVFTVGLEDGQEKLVIVHEIDRQYRKADFDEVIRNVRRAVADLHELEVHAVVLIRHMSLPRTTSGKAQRHICREQFERGEHKVLAEWRRPLASVSAGPDNVNITARGERLNRADRPMTVDEVDRLAERIESWLLTWLVERAAIPQHEVHRDKPFAEYGLDSLTAVELSHELDDTFGVEVVPTVAWNYPTPAALSKYLAEEASGMNAAQTAPDDADGAELDDEFARMLAEIEAMSDDEVQSQLDSEEEADDLDSGRDMGAA